MFLPQCERPSFTPIQNNRQNYSSAHLERIRISDNNIEEKTCWTEWYQAFSQFGLFLIYNNAVCCWTVTALQRRRIEAAEMKLLRPLAGYTLHDHKTNDSVRRELQTECILGKTDEYRRNWLLHLQRMSPNRIPLKSYHYRPQGRRTIGRPKKRWREQL